MNNRILLFKEQILSNLQSPPTIEEMSAQINVSLSRLRQMFKSETGLPFGEYVRHLRLERARELLETTFLRISEISAAVGIRDQSYFVRIFKEKYNLTPTEYRDKNHKDFKSINKNS